MQARYTRLFGAPPEKDFSCCRLIVAVLLVAYGFGRFCWLPIPSPHAYAAIVASINPFYLAVVWRAFAHYREVPMLLVMIGVVLLDLSLIMAMCSTASGELQPVLLSVLLDGVVSVALIGIVRCCVYAQDQPDIECVNTSNLLALALASLPSLLLLTEIAPTWFLICLGVSMLCFLVASFCIELPKTCDEVLATGALFLFLISFDILEIPI